MGNPGYGSTEDDQVIAAVHRAMELGVTLFDMAPNYGFGQIARTSSQFCNAP